MKVFLFIFAVLSLAGCSAAGARRDLSPDEEAGLVYVCRNGDTVNTVYGSQGKAARISVGDVTVQMDPVQAPFGEKFRAEDGTMFWVNGQDVLMEWTNGAMLFCREQGK